MVSGSTDLPPARTADAIPRTALAWQRTLVSIFINTVLLSLVLSRSGQPLWALGVLGLAVAAVPAVVSREQSLTAATPAPVAEWKLRLVSAVVVLLAVSAAAATFLG